MTGYILRRTLIALGLVWVVVSLVFVLVRFMPGDALLAMAGEKPQGLSPAQRAVMERELGLDRPLHVQYVSWAARIARGDLGQSISSRRPVTRDILVRVPRTLELAAAGLIVGLLIGVPLGVVTAVHRGTWLDRVITGTLVVVGSLPVFVFGIALILIFGLGLRWVPTGGYVPFTNDPWAHLRLLVLPAVTLGLWIGSVTARMTRNSMLDALSLDYVRTAAAKGLNDRQVLYRHALRNALIPVVTAVGLQVGSLLGGAVLTEVVFTWPGLGSALVSAVERRDYPVVQAVIILTSAGFVFTNLLVDVLVGLLDPRIAY